MTAEDSTPRRGYVYLARAADVHKIGKARNPKSRVSQLGKPFGPAVLVHVIPHESPFVLERRLHHHFRDKWVQGEWFRLNEDDVAYFKSLRPGDVEVVLKPQSQDRMDATLAGLAQRVLALRVARGLSLGDVSLRINLAKGTIHDIERGRNKSPTLHLLWALADAYGVTIDELVGRA